jgi:hypothetical protein
MLEYSAPTKLITTHTKFFDLWFRFVILCVFYVCNALGIKARERNIGFEWYGGAAAVAGMQPALLANVTPCLQRPLYKQVVLFEILKF